VLDGSPADLPDLSRPRKVHLVGAGGTGMSAIATVLLEMGHQVSGSDAVFGRALDDLGARGAAVHAGHDPAWVGDAEIVARSSAVPVTDVEVLEAERRGLRVWRRSQLLAALCSGSQTIAVAGTHGKTTTSAILAVILREAGLHPSMVVGAGIVGLETGGAWDPAGEWMVVEADESDGTFLALGAQAAVVTSVEADHLDFYGSVDGVREAFGRFVAAVPGPVVICADDPGALASAGPAGAVVTYGTSRAAAVRISGVSLGRLESAFCLSEHGEAVAEVQLAVPGLHNVRNAAAAIAMANAVGVPWERAALGAGAYRGVHRRFEVRGELEGVTFVDDYAHLPSEVAAAVAAASVGGWRRVVVVFQPHRYSRTEALWAAFADAFGGADVLVVTDVYPAGEPSRPGVSGRLIATAVAQRHPDLTLTYAPTLDDAEAELRRMLEPGDLCLTLGAGDLTALPDRFVTPRGDGARG
jgi:UDP-N-acetylmuramate--alanine ligase